MTADAVGGVWTYALDLAGALARAGLNITLAVFGPPPDCAQRTQVAALPEVELVETGLPLDWTAEEPADLLEGAAALRGLARARRADLVHLNSPALAAIGGFPAPVVGVCHSCLATWWAAVQNGPMPPPFRWRTEVMRQGLLACDALIAPTAVFADAIAQVYGSPRPLVIPNGRKADVSAVSAREPCVFTCGRLWDEGKNIGVLDAAAALVSCPLHAAGPIVGPNGERAKLQRINYLGRLSSKAVLDRLARAPIFASSALYEPFGLGVLEAAQAGCALVLSDIATFRELWDGAAIFVDPRDAGGFAQAFQSLFADPAATARLGQAARARAARYTVDSMRDGVLQVYRRLAPSLAVSLREAAA